MSAELRGAVAALRADPVAARGMRPAAGRPTRTPSNARELPAGPGAFCGKRHGYAEAQRQTSGLRGAGHVAVRDTSLPTAGRRSVSRGRDVCASARSMRSGSSGLLGSGMVATPSPRGRIETLRTSKRTGYVRSASAHSGSLAGAAAGAPPTPRGLRARSPGNASTTGSVQGTLGGDAVRGLMNQPDAPAPELLRDRDYHHWRSLSPGGKCMAYAARNKGTRQMFVGLGEGGGAKEAVLGGERRRHYNPGKDDRTGMLRHEPFRRSASCGSARGESPGRRGLRVIHPVHQSPRQRSLSTSNRPEDTLERTVGLVGQRAAPVNAQWKAESPGRPTKFRAPYPLRPPPPPPVEKGTGRQRAPSPSVTPRSASPAGRRRLSEPQREYSILAHGTKLLRDASPSRRHYPSASSTRRIGHYANGQWTDTADGLHTGRRHVRSQSRESTGSQRGRARGAHAFNGDPSCSDIIVWRR